MTQEKLEIIQPHARAPKWILAEAEVAFEGGLLDGVKLVGFTVTKSKSGKLRVMLPQKDYMSGGQKQYFDFVRAVLHPSKVEELKEAIIAAYEEWKEQR